MYCVCVCVCVCVSVSFVSALVCACANKCATKLFLCVLCLCALLDRGKKGRGVISAKGSAKIMVTVVATKDLKAGEVLRRFQAKAVQYQPRPGNNNNRFIDRYIYIAVGLEARGWR